MSCSAQAAGDPPTRPEGQPPRVFASPLAYGSVTLQEWRRGDCGAAFRQACGWKSTARSDTNMWGTLHWGSPAGSSTSVPSGRWSRPAPGVMSLRGGARRCNPRLRHAREARCYPLATGWTWRVPGKTTPASGTREQATMQWWAHQARRQPRRQPTRGRGGASSPWSSARRVRVTAPRSQRCWSRAGSRRECGL